jgi:hypothetical protein
MKAPYTSVVNSLTGHCIAAEADETVHVPEDVVAEAMEKGWIRVEEPADVEAPEQLSDNVTESPSVEVDEEVDDFQVELDQAVLRVITRNQASDFKPDGKPKVNSVVAEMSPDVKKRPTAGAIGKTFERMQDNINLSDD